MLNPNFVKLDNLEDFAQKVQQDLKNNDIVSLVGDLGSGKTTFLFHLMQSLGMEPDQHFSSPTFTILNRYQLKNHTINHVDLYRLNHFEELESLDIIRLFYEPGALTFVEWGDKFSEMQEMYTCLIQFAHVPEKPNIREIALNHVR